MRNHESHEIFGKNFFRKKTFGKTFGGLYTFGLRAEWRNLRSDGTVSSVALYLGEDLYSAVVDIDVPLCYARRPHTDVGGNLPNLVTLQQQIARIFPVFQRQRRGKNDIKSSIIHVYVKDR